jgi:hypothetical protein
VQHFGQLGLHPGALSGGENDACFGHGLSATVTRTKGEITNCDSILLHIAPILTGIS